jgi:putative MATE family efflux protein
MENKLAQNFNFFSLIKFSLPTMIMLFFVSLYVMVDGVFVSRFVNTNAFAAINIVYPLFSMLFAISSMLASGGSALVAKKMGEKKDKQAKQYFSLIVLSSAVIGLIFALICLIFIKPIIYLLGSDDAIYQYCYDYIVPILIFSPLCILQMIFHSFFITAGKPKMGLIATLTGGTTNIIFDYIFIVLSGMGIAGAAYGTIVGFIAQNTIGILYFTFKRKGTLYFVKPSYNILAVVKSCYNGVAECIGNLSVSITTFLFNIEMMKYIGVDGVAAITIILYAEFILMSVFYGYSSGVAPVFSYNYGSKNTYQLKNIFKISTIFIVLSSVLICFLSLPAAPYIIDIFAKENSHVFYIALKGFFIFAISFLFTGTNIFAAAMFTAFSNGKTAGIIMFLRTFLFLSLSILLLPLILNVNGIWLAVPTAEFLSVSVSVFYFVKYKNIYNYL